MALVGSPSATKSSFISAHHSSHTHLITPSTVTVTSCIHGTFPTHHLQWHQYPHLRSQILLYSHLKPTPRYCNLHLYNHHTSNCNPRTGTPDIPVPTANTVPALQGILSLYTTTNISMKPISLLVL